MIENTWRAEYCPSGYPELWCECPFEVEEYDTCDGAWYCDDIFEISIEFINYYDTNYDGSINIEDDIDPEHMDQLNAECDFNNDGNLDACEVHDCIVIVENNWRAEHCPELGEVYCDCPFYTE